MNLDYLSLSQLRELLDTKQVSSLELTQYFLERIHTYNPQLNAYLNACEEEALSQAKDADEYMAEHEERSALCGIPYSAKDLFATKGIKTTAASKILDNWVASYDATAIKKLKNKKAVLLGKTNLDEFAHGSSTETSAYGPTKNPWDNSRIPGGSSGGATSAQSAGLCAFALGTETGGSIRQPSSLCSVSGLKPTYGRVSRYGVISMASSLDSPGPIAGSAKDLALILEEIAGQDQNDSTTGSQQVEQYAKNLSTDIKGLKIGIPTQYFLGEMDTDVKQKVLDAIEQVKRLGAETVEVDLPNTKYGSLVYAIICPSEISSNLARFDGIRFGHVSPLAQELSEIYSKSRAEGFGVEAKRRILTGTYVLSAGYYDAYYKKAQKVRRLIVNEFTDVFTKVDALIAPTVPNVAPEIGTALKDPLFGYIADQLNIPSSLAGLPAVSIPVGFSQNLPVGMQIIGPQWSEQRILNIAHTYQEVTAWHKEHPVL
ncbi:MAG: Asp-tRNA(Asn)/Glu-tRNA(Gln) amidotransferase subunit GatA [bacterium]|nr:Asp-tRNA(Asn)/Glu-tRNA(Gln) amidotransferase subunit GatA [bacterium]